MQECIDERRSITHQVPEDGEEDAAGGDVGGDLGGEAGGDDDDEDEEARVEEVEDGELRSHPGRQPRDLRGLGQGETTAEEEHERPGHPVVDDLPPQQAGGGGGRAQICNVERGREGVGLSSFCGLERIGLLCYGLGRRSERNSHSTEVPP